LVGPTDSGAKGSKGRAREMKRSWASGDLASMTCDALQFLMMALGLALVALAGSACGGVEGSKTQVAIEGAIVFVAREHDQTNIYLLNAEGIQRVAGPAALFGAPRWSPDGEWIAYTSTSGQIVVVRRDGSDQQVLVPQPGVDFGPCTQPIWSPDGKRIAFTEQYANGVKLWSVRVVDGRGRKELISFASSWPGGYENSCASDWSPKGITVPSWDGIGALAVKSGRIREIVRNLDPFDDPYADARWSPDSKRIAFCMRRGDASDEQIYVVRADGHGLHALTQPGGGSMPAWSPDGKQVVFVTSRDAESVCLWLMNADGSGAQQLTTHHSIYPDWTSHE
jgi:TolB protein